MLDRASSSRQLLDSARLWCDYGSTEGMIWHLKCLRESDCGGESGTASSERCTVARRCDALNDSKCNFRL